MTTVKRQCDCKHTYQDEKYGKGVRIHNQTTDVNPVQYRCTVCQKVRP